MGYPKEVYRQAFDILEERRRKNHNTYENRKQEIHSIVPQIAEIEQKMAATAAASIYEVASGKDNSGDIVASLGRENLALQREREALLIQAGYPGDYLAARHNCSQCSDAGYIGVEMCDCLHTLLRDIAYSHMSDNARLPQYRFETFDLSYYPDHSSDSKVTPRSHMSDVLAYCKQYASQFSTNSESLLLMGQTGQGKTHLSISIAREASEQGFGVIYMPFQKLIDRLEVGKFSFESQIKERYKQDLQGIMECDLLVLDDLGAEFVTSFSIATAYNIINTRLVEQRPTIINTNLELADMESRYSQRIASRLGFSYKVLPFAGEDIRYLKRTRK